MSESDIFWAITLTQAAQIVAMQKQVCDSDRVSEKLEQEVFKLKMQAEESKAVSEGPSDFQF